MSPPIATVLLRTQSDERLARLAAAGHERAFEAIVERYRQPLSRHLRRLLPEALRDDVLQQTFVSAWTALRGGTGVRDLRPWLYRIGHNQAVRALTRAASTAPPVAAESQAIVDDGVEHRAEVRAALHGVAELPERQRTALMAIAVHGRSHADVAAELGLSDGALRQLVHRARGRVRSAASAITPLPIVHWLVGQPNTHVETTARIAELTTAAGGAGVAAAFKLGAVVVAASAVVAPQVASVVAPTHHHATAVRRLAAVAHRTAPVSVHAHAAPHLVVVATTAAVVTKPAVAATRRPAVVLHHHHAATTTHTTAPSAWSTTTAAPPPPLATTPTPQPAAHHHKPAADHPASPAGGSDAPAPITSGPSGTVATVTAPTPPTTTATTPAPAAAPPTVTPPAGDPAPPAGSGGDGCHEVACRTTTTTIAPPPPPAHTEPVHTEPPATTTTTETTPVPPAHVCYDNCPPGVTPTPRP